MIAEKHQNSYTGNTKNHGGWVDCLGVFLFTILCSFAYHVIYVGTVFFFSYIFDCFFFKLGLPKLNDTTLHFC